MPPVPAFALSFGSVSHYDTDGPAALKEPAGSAASRVAVDD
jgi:hypothetical protein